MALLRKGYTLMFVLGDKGDPLDEMYVCSFMPSGLSHEVPCLEGAPQSIKWAQSLLFFWKLWALFFWRSIECSCCGIYGAF